MIIQDSVPSISTLSLYSLLKGFPMSAWLNLTLIAQLSLLDTEKGGWEEMKNKQFGFFLKDMTVELSSLFLILSYVIN